MVLEAKARAGEKSSCTGIVGWECITTFGIDKKVILRQANSATVFSPSGNTLHLHRDEPQACILDRKAFDNYMVELARQAGAVYEFNSLVTDVAIGKDRADVRISRGDATEKISAEAIVIASGFNQAFNERAGAGKSRDYADGAQSGR